MNVTDKEMKYCQPLKEDSPQKDSSESEIYAYSGTSGRLFRFYPDSKPEHPDTLSVS